MRRILSTVTLLLTLAGAAVTANDPAPAPSRLNQIKRECEVFENILDTSIRQAIPHPMLLSERTRGTYLPGYGLVFHLAVNMDRRRILFTPRQAGGGGEAIDLDAVAGAIRACLIEVLGQYGGGLSPTSAQDRVSIVAHILNRPAYATDSSDRVLVVTVPKADISQHRQARINAAEFKKRVACIEY